MSELSVYVHFPFCRRACPYCNFSFRLFRHYDSDFMDAYAQAVLTEWGRRQQELQSSPKIVSLYFGGGTPSLMTIPQLERLISGLSNAKNEVTLEANPEDLREKGPRYLRDLLAIGVNRLSLGVQSLHAQTLKKLGRSHTPGDVRKIVRDVRQAGFTNLSCDLMGACPGQTVQMFAEDLREILFLRPEHISYYTLTIEEKTYFGWLTRRGRLDRIPEAEEAAIFEMAQNVLQTSGYHQYEISNYAKPGCESRHNRGYWEFRDYLGLGASAHSFLKGHRWHLRTMNEKTPKIYLQKIASGQSLFAEEEKLCGEKAMGEFVFTGLRLLRGVSLQRFQDLYGQNLETVFAAPLKTFTTDGLVETVKEGRDWRLRLTPKGVLFSDTVFAAFV